MSDRSLFERLFLDSVVVATEAARAVTDQTGRVMRRLNLGVGPFRLTPEGIDDLRRLAVLQIRHLLEIPDERPSPTGQRAATPPMPDPVAIARAMLELKGDHGHRDDDESSGRDPSLEEEVRTRFAMLLDPEQTDLDGHPAALATIVTQLSPDEARMLRHLHLHGPQPVVDVAAVPRVGRGGHTVAESLSILTERSGGDSPELGPARLANLARLGMVRVSRGEVTGHGDYQLIESSPVFEEAARHVRDDLGQRVRAVRRNVALTPLGAELCRLALEPDAPAVEDEPVDPGGDPDTSPATPQEP